jgi:hypothetical protein
MKRGSSLVNTTHGPWSPSQPFLNLRR